jgi:hypothetical protein
MLLVVMPIARAQQTTYDSVVIFADRPMSDSLYASIESGVREEVNANAAAVRMLPVGPIPSGDGPVAGADAKGSLTIIRGGGVAPGIETGNAIVVYLHENCAFPDAPPHDPFNVMRRVPVSGVLGWVTADATGRIDPFIHVDCSRIGQLLFDQGLSRSPSDREQMLGRAIARVIVHEWIHIATQSAHHAHHGIGQAQFGAADLIANTSKRRPSKHQAANGSAVSGVIPNPASGEASASCCMRGGR